MASCLLLANEASAVTLLTDDINLTNKVEENFETNQEQEIIKSFLIQARANGLRVATSNNVRTELSGGLEPNSRPVKEGYCQEATYRQGGEAAQSQGRAGENFQKESEVARGAVRHLLEVVLMEEFKEAYGDPLWRKVVADNIVLSLFLQCFYRGGSCVPCAYLTPLGPRHPVPALQEAPHCRILSCLSSFGKRVRRFSGQVHNVLHALTITALLTTHLPDCRSVPRVEKT